MSPPQSPDDEAGTARPGRTAAPDLWPPRGGVHFGEYGVRDFAAKFLIQVDDFAEIERYRAANRAERLSSDLRDRVVMFGDSITDFWPIDALPVAPHLRLINRGVAGQNTSVMLLRFQDDVADLEPGAVVILGGTNDLRTYVGDPDAVTEGALERISRNISGMCDMAAGRGIAPLLATLPPVGSDTAAVARSPAGVEIVNRWIRAFASARGYPLVDYHAVLVGSDGLMPDALSEDGVHPNAAAYALMARPLLTALGRLTFSTASATDQRP